MQIEERSALLVIDVQALGKQAWKKLRNWIER